MERNLFPSGSLQLRMKRIDRYSSTPPVRAA